MHGLALSSGGGHLLRLNEHRSKLWMVLRAVEHDLQRAPRKLGLLRPANFAGAPPVNGEINYTCAVRTPLGM